MGWYPNVVSLFAIFWIFWSKVKITKVDAPTIRMDCHPILTNWRPTSAIPTILQRMPFLAQLSLFILAWDGRQLCWLAYPVARCTANLSSKQILLFFQYLLDLIREFGLLYYVTPLFLWVSEDMLFKQSYVHAYVWLYMITIQVL